MERMQRDRTILTRSVATEPSKKVLACADSHVGSGHAPWVAHKAHGGLRGCARGQRARVELRVVLRVVFAEEGGRLGGRGAAVVTPLEEFDRSSFVA